MSNQMTLKGFLHRSKGKVSSIAFLSQHKEWLLSSEVKDLISPIFSTIDNGELMPTLALNNIRQVIYDHMIVRKNEEFKNLEDKNRRKYFAKKEGKFVVTIFDAQKKVVLEKKPTGWFELVKSFELPQDAQRWADRKLINNVGCFGEIQSYGKMYEIIEREGSLFRILRTVKKTVYKRLSKNNTNRLSFGVKACQKTTKFSTG